MEQTVKQALIEQFRAYLDEAQARPPPEPENDAFSLLAELAGLKTEVKREARQFKEALDQFKASLGTLQARNEALSRELKQRRAAETTLQREALRPLLLQLLELRDRLEAGVALKLTPQRGLLARFRQRQDGLLESLREGQRMTLRRLDRVLEEHGVQPLEVLDQPFDPHTMRAVEVETRTDRPQAIVTGELRKGFLWDEELLRLAEVKVNKRDDNS